MTVNVHFAAVCAVVTVLAGSAQAQLFERVVQEPASPGGWSVAGPRPINGRGTMVRVDVAALADRLEKAPKHRFDAGLREHGLSVVLPSPTGEMIECAVAESAVMEAPLQERFGQIRTYIVQSRDGGMSGRLELSPRGLTAMLRCLGDADHPTGRTWMIDPWQSGDPAHAVSYWLHDLPGGMDWVCETTAGVHGDVLPVDEHEHEHEPRGETPQVLRTFRLAVACTGEYGVHQSTIQGHAPNVTDPLAAIVTVVSRTNVVYEQDLAVHLNLVANNDQIVYFDPVTDPYPDSCDGMGGSDCSGPYLAPNITNLADRIGTDNFDIGHLLTRVAGGVAYLRATCGQNKAGGISGIPRGGDIDPFSALVVIHEIGHQMGANHTFSGTRGRCGNNANLPTAWEAGSGSSPMAYAGGCPVGSEPPSDNIVEFADPFFHHGSLMEMQTFLQGNNATCAALTTTSNLMPEIASTTENTAIPPGTPFTLMAVASDGNANDTLTYSWEQRDSGVRRPLTGKGSEDNGMGALFRIFPPVTSGQRTFPRMSDILSGIPTPGEKLPTVTDVIRRFRVVVRDNHPGMGGVVIRSTSLSVTIAAGTTPFTVVSPTEGTVWSEGSRTVTWTVGGTAAAPVSCASVTIWLSTDNGATFAHNLGTFPNTGSASVVVPPDITSTGRVRVDGDGEIFFAMSRPFGLRAPCAADRNHDDRVNSQDYFHFLTAFFEGTLAADFDNDGTVDSQDFFDFLSVFFAGCV